MDAGFGRLAEVRVGGARARAVDVAFIDDARLGDTPLLGMSFLSRFRTTIGQDGDVLVLTVR